MPASDSHPNCKRLIEGARDGGAVQVAQPHSCGRQARGSALDAARFGMIAPVLAAPRAGIGRAAAEARPGISSLPHDEPTIARHPLDLLEQP